VTGADWGLLPTHLAVQWTHRTVCGLETSDKAAHPHVDSRWVDHWRVRGMRFCSACTGQVEAEMPGQLGMW
jgi:hypothetical protein